MAGHFINWNPTRRELLWFAGLLIPFGLLASGLWWGRTGQSTGPLALCVTLAFLGVVGLRWPSAIRWFYVAWMIVAWPIGWSISHLLLAMIFFGVICPIGVMLRCLGKDPMQKEFDRAATTYWIPRSSEPTPLSRYFRQF